MYFQQSKVTENQFEPFKGRWLIWTCSITANVYIWHSLLPLILIIMFAVHFYFLFKCKIAQFYTGWTDPSETALLCSINIFMMPTSVHFINPYKPQCTFDNSAPAYNVPIQKKKKKRSLRLPFLVCFQSHVFCLVHLAAHLSSAQQLLFPPLLWRKLLLSQIVSLTV